MASHKSWDLDLKHKPRPSSWVILRSPWPSQQAGPCPSLPAADLSPCLLDQPWVELLLPWQVAAALCLFPSGRLQHHRLAGLCLACPCVSASRVHPGTSGAPRHQRRPQTQRLQCAATSSQAGKTPPLRETTTSGGAAAPPAPPPAPGPPAPGASRRPPAPRACAAASPGARRRRGPRPRSPRRPGLTGPGAAAPPPPRSPRSRRPASAPSA
mmetsp:Transcript_39911/g.114999  ORF Transcript_39911/g.114999 Transcript_39911/m.114999 type:complete len:212 (+) Transcript_39911:1521-2156(+)